MTINVDLGDELEQFVTRMVESGLYSSKESLFREGLKLLSERDFLASVDEATERGDFDEAIAAGLKDVEEGRVVTIEQARQELSALFDKPKKRSVG